ncbi:uncharacterized protein METZ01_LOCUS187305 [marine metagenome]|uniref:Uncharacterized protein n=1 Tax=marine metagenome TaxID=408172 RepID=A0A382D9U2_9ZZZZ
MPHYPSYPDQTQFGCFIASLTESVWFARLGAKADSKTEQIAQGYLPSVDRDNVRIKFVTGWDEAPRAARGVGSGSPLLAVS